MNGISAMQPERFESLVQRKCVERGHIPEGGRCLRCGGPVAPPARPEDASRETEPATPRAKRAKREKVVKELPGAHPGEVIADVGEPERKVDGVMPHMPAHRTRVCRRCERPITSQFQMCVETDNDTCEALALPARRIVGIDPGFASIGWCVLEIGVTGAMHLDSMGVFGTKKATKKAKALAVEDNVRRAIEIAGFLRTLIEVPGTIAICAEAMSFPRSASVAAKMAMTWGELILLSHVLRIPLFQATPQEIKIAACGKRTASKEEIQDAMRTQYKRSRKLQMPIRVTAHEHCFDALAAADTCAKGPLLRMARKS